MSAYSYATIADYVRMFGYSEAVEQTNLDDPSATTINETELSTALEAATAEVNGHLAVRYSIPLPAPSPVAVVEMVCKIARKNLDRYARREHVQQDYEDVIQRLTRIAKRQEALVTESGEILSPATSQNTQAEGISFGGGRRTFTRENLRNFGQSWE